MAFRDDFEGGGLDTATWLPHYLPMWTSRAESAATHRVEDSTLVLSIPPEQGLWCAEEHPTPLRVSAVQTGNRSGPVGSTAGQQAIFEGQLVREEQEHFEGLLLTGGRLEVRCAMTISPRSMAAAWLCGFEETPEDCGEICLVEVFGKDVVPGASAEVGVGLKQIRDPRLRTDFEAPRLDLDVAAFHTYAASWDEREAVFSVDGTEVRRCPDPPAYPLQLVVAVFDFPDESTGDDALLVPELVVDRVDWLP